MEWNSQLYDNKHDFVAEYGKGLLEFIPDNKEQTILDLGCGTGVLTAQLRDYGSKVIGVDSSENMIDKAKKQFGNIEFMVCDALDLPFENEFDVVFSNAVFHWISDHDALLSNVKKVLKSHGLLVCEFGANGNISTIENAFVKVYSGLGYEYAPKFNFPTSESFGKLLEKKGVVIYKVYDYDRPTPLKNAEQGLANWIKQFFASELSVMSDDMQDTVIKKVEGLTRESLWNGKEWIADYRRLRAIAHL
ncbi:class I SAM-dependent methyltransferase [Brachyspira sp.]|uniref:class I SAM-dependent methyltransferase n=1 Tax=Brachyspira sp. TaxID=1977261 RepID=UPI003D7D4C07